MRLIGGDRLTSRRFRQLGMWLGDSAGFELLHHVLELPFGSRAFLIDVENAIRYERNPIYATLHESSYADGGPTRWSADRLMPDEVRDGRLFTAEHVFPWMFEDYGALRSHREAAMLLAEHDWPRLYDPDRLAHNEVPVAATIYVNDLYVERTFAEETAAGIRGLRPWITNEFEHNGSARRRRAGPRPPHRPRPRTRLTDRAAMGQIALATRRPSRTASSTVRGARQSPIPWTSPIERARRLERRQQVVDRVVALGQDQRGHVLDDDRVARQDVLEEDGRAVVAEEPDQRDHLHPGPGDRPDHRVADVLLDALPRHVAVDAERDLPAALGEQLGHPEADPVAAPVGDDDPAVGHRRRRAGPPTRRGRRARR